MLKTIFGQVLKAQRKDRNFTQEHLAESSGLSTYYIALLEAGKRQPTLTTLFKLAAALNTTPDKLIKIVRQQFHHRHPKR